MPRISRTAFTCLTCLCSSLLAASLRAETDWVLVLDRSESMVQNDPLSLRFDAQKILVHLLAQGAGETHRLTIIRFSGTPEAVLVREPITTEKLEGIRKTIAEDPPQGDTDIGAALALARSVAQPEGRATDVHVILLSDGVQAGKIPNLQERLAAEEQAFRDLGVNIDTILLNDHSIAPQERRARRQQRVYYDDKQLQVGADLLREVARKTGGKSAAVRPDLGIEDILLDLLSPYFSFYRQPIGSRIETWPTDRQLFFFLDRRSGDLKLRVGTRELELSLAKPQHLADDFEIFVDPYQNRTVVTLRPAAGVRWPSHVELLPGASGNSPSGDVFVIANVQLAVVPGADGAEGTAEAFKRRVREHELYPLRFRILPAVDLPPERERSVDETLRKSQVRVEVAAADGEIVEEKVLAASELLGQGSSRLYFLPTRSPRGGAKAREPFPLVVRATLEAGAGGIEGGARLRPLCRAPERALIVEPTAFEWVARRNWKGEPASASRPLPSSGFDIELGQEMRFEVQYGGQAALGDVSLQASFGRRGEPSAKRFGLRDAGGVPRVFHTDWIFPFEPGEYEAKVRIKSDAVQELGYTIRVLRDDFRGRASRYSPDGKDDAAGRDLGAYFTGETVLLERIRTLNHLNAEATAKRWEAEAAVPTAVSILRQDAASGGWTVVGQAPVAPGAPAPGGAELHVTYRGEAGRLEPGAYLAAWPEKRPFAADPAADQRADRLRILGPALLSSFLGEDGKPLPVENGRPTTLAGSRVVLKAAPTSEFPPAFAGEVRATLTWARKNAGPPRTVAGARSPDGSFAMELAATEFDAGPARVRLEMAWQESGRQRLVVEEREIFVRTKALNVIVEPLDEAVLIGQRSAAIRFRVRASGGANAQVQRDLLGIWRSQPATVTVGESEQLHSVDLAEDSGSLIGSLPLPPMDEGNYKLVVSSPAARLGQDSAACFFDVRPCPYSATLLWSSLNVDERPLLAPGTTQARCDGEGAAAVVIERRAPEAGKPPPPGVTATELHLNGVKAEARWVESAGKLRSSPLSLEGLERHNELEVAVTDASGRSFILPLGKLEVVPVPLSYEVGWTRPPPAVLGRGEVFRARGALLIRGGFLAQREEARREVEKAAAPWILVEPASALAGIEILPVRDDGASPEAVLGARVQFSATLRADVNDAALKDSFVLAIAPPRPSAGGAAAAPLERRTISIGPATHQLRLGRLDDQGAVAAPDALPWVAREQLRVKIESSAPVQGAARIQVFATSEAGGAELLVASADGPQLDFIPRKEGAYRVAAALEEAQEQRWAVEEQLKVLGPLRLEWGQAAASALKLDAGQKLPLSVKVVGPPGLDGDSFSRWFTLRPEIFGEGGQALVVECTPWEAQKESAPGGLLLAAYSAKPLSASAAKLRVHLGQRFAPADAAPLDTITLDLVRGGGSLVAVDRFEAGPDGYEVRDLASGFHVPRQSRIRFGYRLGGTVDAAESLKDGVTAIVVAQDGSEKVLDVEAAARELLVFTPYEAQAFGRYTLRLEIRGKAPLKRDFELEIVKGRTEWAMVAGVAAAGLLLVIALAVLAWKGVGYRKDRGVVAERVTARREKALAELAAEPRQSLTGSVRITVASQTIGPLELKGIPTMREVEAWVDQHFSMEASIFSDARKNESRREMIRSLLNGARTNLCFEAERRLPVRSADLCVREARDGQPGSGKLEALVVQESSGPQAEGLKSLLSLRLIADAKLRIATASGRSVTLSPAEDFPYNGWIGKQGGQIRASVKVPGIADYATLIIDLKV